MNLFLKIGRVLLLIIPLLSGIRSLAQAPFQVFPLTQAQENGSLRGARTQAVSLPFFDDFSITRTGIPDPALWASGGGTVVNNTMATTHPSLNMVTFDGLRRDGTPYDFSNQYAQGLSDSLTSLPIDLSSYSIRDSLYLSFHWLSKGLGDQPDSDDSLRVQFLTNGNLWQTVWVTKGGQVMNEFAIAMIPVKAALYLHAGFQFRIEAFGRKSGPFDAWHVDYVYLNRGRNSNDRYIKDVSIRRSISSYLKHYRTMPLAHYLINPAAETADTISTDITNLFNNNNFTTLRFRAQEMTTNQQIQNFTQTISENIPQLRSQEKFVRPTPLPAFGGTRAVIRTTFDILTTDDQNPSIPGVDLRRNDTLSSTTELSNYFAYDDGTAEYAAGINQKYGYVAVRFILRKEDVVSGIRFQPIRYKTDITNQSIAVYVLQNQGNKPGQTMTRQSFAIRYPSDPRGFVEMKFQYPPAVKDTFWLAYQQLSDDVVAIGLDKNTPQFANQIYYNLGNEWVGNTTLAGTLLLRPVMGGQSSELITGVEDISEDQLMIHPNPSAGPIRWNLSAFRSIEVFDVSGRRLYANSNATDSTADLSGLRRGLYLIRLSNGRQSFVKKLVIEN
ncbi:MULTISPECIES: T9SS type A sorting domain-containing protein [unclassified Siphonobacter]|uniref:T9SS type A sorting domain-containing protein n=1 Tax=unclassified Siphonobacter TaxID=2635712 RepID=UPI0012FE8BD1|nr:MULTISPECIES: T9SS type A sorting domain-containing protein [unclassified Siphonobacter]MDQ1085868.1 hypothetical protein [Siphonobacter sp. SORGH_AS_1065]